MAVQDPSQGLLVKLWTARADKKQVLLSADGVPEVVIYTHAEPVNAVTLAFDQNGNPNLTVGGISGALLYWYDATRPGMETTSLPADHLYPMLTLDDARDLNIAASDIILSYVRGGVLRYRQQRERFQIEHTPLLGDGGSPLTVPGKPLLHVSMTRKQRVQWTFLNTDNWAMNPAHALYYARTHSEIGREPSGNINDASYRACADKLFDEGFGICTSFDPAAESLEEFEQRICNLIGGSVSRSLIDGQYYLDLARGDYDLDSLPVITDDDILSFSAQPSVLDGAINSVSVKYFDPCRKESVTTPPVQALGLIDAFGVIHQTASYPEIPSAALALIIAERDLRNTVTPTIAFELTCMPDSVRALRPNNYFRLQSKKRRIADMVCLLGEKQAGTLKSGAVKITAAQDIYSLPQTSFVEVESGIDTSPDPTPYPITAQVAMEAPYIELVQRLDRANLDALPADVGYLLAMADQPAQGGQNYGLAVAPAGGDYLVEMTGDWCPVAVVAGDPAVDVVPVGQTVIPVAGVGRASQVTLGAAALWESEVVRIDAIDTEAGTVTVGRGCADTVPVEHVAGSRIWVYDEAASSNMTEYTDGEAIDIKLLTNTAVAQLDPADAVAMSVEFARRAVRPYPPAAVTFNGEAWPPALTGQVDVVWAHRDRKAQADQLVDQAVASIGPEPGTTYTVRWILDGVEVHAEAGIVGSASSYTPAAAGTLRIEIQSQRDGLDSLQVYRHTAEYIPTP
ncbi:hypothetical protein ARC78_06795 [Stenotrophomonas pictorum JCM 9942]|uniref:Tip attachment protein J domain-containing protein n=1 Tax=Stenotrophomonas pictorum JCM 9942 TaxID=1236960 RepID=A0A0R0AFU0_9GAMM|nr:hypothetical protein [Stenotrophomonas pictorum]KRG43773.1 hypothetical protein ARC78_06795 [Stenotrophomonas pictorum JCM 9942]